MLKKLARIRNTVRKVRMTVEGVPVAFLSFLLEDPEFLSHFPAHKDLINNSAKYFAAQRHGIETAIMLVEKHEDFFTAGLRSQRDIVQAMKNSYDNNTMTQWMTDPSFVRKQALAI